MSDTSYPQRKKIRVDPVVYSEPAAICSITIAVLKRIALFSNYALANDCVSLLRSEAKDESVHRVVEYILNNPVRQGMVVNWQEYPFGGSLVYNLRV